MPTAPSPGEAADPGPPADDPLPAGPSRFFIVGPTASGKASLAVALAERVGGEIISVDSMKIYRGMDIGTAKPSKERQQRVRFHGIDLVDPGPGPGEPWSVAHYVAAAEAAENAIRAVGREVIYCGGTAFYVKALTEGLFDGPPAQPAVRSRLRALAAREGSEALHEVLAQVDPVSSRRIHPNDVRRLVRALEVHEVTGSPLSTLQTQWKEAPRCNTRVLIGVGRDREDLYDRINRRVMRMFDEGLVAEVEQLIAAGGVNDQAAQALGYRELLAWHREGACLDRLSEVMDEIQRHTRRFARQQLTWWRRFPDLVWLDVGPDDAPEPLADELARRYF